MSACGRHYKFAQMSGNPRVLSAVTTKARKPVKVPGGSLAGAVFAEVVHRPLFRYRIRRRKGGAPGQLGLVLRRLDQNGQILSALRLEITVQFPGKALPRCADQLPVGRKGRYGSFKNFLARSTCS